MEATKKRFATGLIAIAICSILSICLAGCSSSSSSPKEQNVAESSSNSSEPIDLEIVDSGYYIDEYMKGSYIEQWGVLIENKNSDWAAQDIKVTVTGRDKEGKVVGTGYEYLTVLFANGKSAVGGECFIDGAETLEFKIEESRNMWEKIDLQQADADSVWYIEGLNHKTDSYGEVTVGGELVNKSESLLTTARVNLLFLDGDGKIVAGGQTYVDNVSAGSSTPFSYTGYSLPKFASVQAYVDTGMPEE